MTEIMTSKGLINEDLLVYTETSEQVPAGTLIKRTYTLDGEVVKQDIEVQVSHAAISSIGQGGL